ncbi:hypothetical protein PJI19_29290, partial [Mycobacterium kansasii]
LERMISLQVQGLQLSLTSTDHSEKLQNHDLIDTPDIRQTEPSFTYKTPFALTKHKCKTSFIYTNP